MSTTQRNAVTVTGQVHGQPMVFAHGYGCDQSDNRDDLAEVRTPALILQCAEDVIAPAAVGDYVHKRLAGSTLVAMNATGHCPNLSAPAETVAAIRAFL